MTRISVVAVVVALASIVAAAAGCGGGEAGGANLTLVAYSTPREAYEKILSAFRDTPAGKGVSFEQSYGSSGEQSRAIEAGLPADVVALSLEPDVTRLVEAGLVDESWKQDEFDGMVTDSVVALIVRNGNPEGIKGWDDLTREGIEVITPNPFTSGGARWNVMAAYGAQRETGKSHEQSVAYLEQLFDHVSVQDKSARESLQTFSSGKGDVLLGYENEAILAQAKGEQIDYVVPDQTILIENPVAVVNETGSPEQADAFVDFLRSPKAQRIFGQNGYRPVVESVLGEFDFPEPPGLFTIEDVGGWKDVTERFFDRESGIVARIEIDLGVSTESS